MRDMNEPEDLFSDFLERAEKAGTVDLHLRIMRTPEGKLDFYIHPQGRDGETGDFTVSGGFVTKLKFCAGSSRPMITLVGSSENPSST